MGNKKRSDYYNNLRYEQELSKKERKEKREQKESGEMEIKEIQRFRFLRIVLLPNLINILLNNLCLILTCLPVFLLIELTLQTGGLIFMAGAWLSMALLFPGLTATYHRSYEYVRRIAPSVRTNFFIFFRKNFKTGALTGLSLGFLWILCIFYFIMAQVWMADSPSFYFLILLLLFLTSYYTTMVIAQISLFDLPMKAVFRNALLLIPSCTWRGLIPTLLQLAYLMLLFQNPNLGLFLTFLGLPSIIAALTAWLLWPRLSEILLRDPEEKSEP